MSVSISLQYIENRISFHVDKAECQDLKNAIDFEQDRNAPCTWHGKLVREVSA
jgi:hypothetical protein